jgi:hypothetical protein
MATEEYKNLISIVSLITVIGLSVILKIWPYGINRTFSQHVARHKASIIYYILLFSIILPLLLLYIFNWFIPTFNPPTLFGFLLVLASVSQYGCVLVPETGGCKTFIHQMLAFLEADCLLPATLLIALTPAVSPIGRAVAAISSLLMATIIAIFVKAYVKNKGQHKYLLVIQASYFALFFITLIVATYTA